MFEKRYTRQEVIDALKKAKSMYFGMAEEMAEDGAPDDAVVKMENFAVAVGDVAFEIECGNILR